jgi:hypothetical protein
MSTDRSIDMSTNKMATDMSTDTPNNKIATDKPTNKMATALSTDRSTDMSNDKMATDMSTDRSTNKMATVYCPYGQHFFVDILCCIHTFCQQKSITPRCSIVVHVFKGAAIL